MCSFFFCLVDGIGYAGGGSKWGLNNRKIVVKSLERVRSINI